MFPNKSILAPRASYTDSNWGEVFIRATITTDEAGNFGPVQHNAGSFCYWTKADARKAIRNWDLIDFKSCSHVAIDAETRIAYQASGYSYNRGSYCDVFTADALRPYVDQYNAEHRDAIPGTRIIYQPFTTPAHPFNVQIWTTGPDGKPAYTGIGYFAMTREQAEKYARKHTTTA